MDPADALFLPQRVREPVERISGDPVEALDVVGFEGGDDVLGDRVPGGGHGLFLSREAVQTPPTLLRNSPWRLTRGGPGGLAVGADEGTVAGHDLLTQRHERYRDQLQ